MENEEKKVDEHEALEQDALNQEVTSEETEEVTSEESESDASAEVEEAESAPIIITPLFDAEGNFYEDPVRIEIHPEDSPAIAETNIETEEEILEPLAETPLKESAEAIHEKIVAEAEVAIPVEATEVVETIPEPEPIVAEEEVIVPVEETEEVESIPEPEAIVAEEEVIVPVEATEEVESIPEPETIVAEEEVTVPVEIAEEAETLSEHVEPVVAEEIPVPLQEPETITGLHEPDHIAAETEDVEEIEDHQDYSALSREEIVVAMEELIADEKAVQFRQKAGKLKIAFRELIKHEKDALLAAFIAEGGERDQFVMEPDELSLRFEAALAVYRDKKQKQIEEQEEVKKQNLQKKLEMLERIKELINSEEPLKKTYDEFRGIQDRWREIGNVPKGEISNLWQSYHFLVEKFFDKVKINNELRDLDMKKNLEKKIELCEKAEELLLEVSVLKSFKLLQRYHQEWKEIGAVPNDKKDELWERFRAATEKINERRREYYEQLHSEQENNFAAKRALCEKMEEVMATLPESINDWQSTNDEVNELMKMWRSLGPAPRQHNEEIWKRFKGLVDEFFNQKKNHLTSVKDEQVNNYNLKLDICQQAEALKDSTDWKETTDELIRLQQEWKKVGPVPRRHADKIWKRFRGACDEFFTKKQAHFASQKDSEEENLKIKEGLIERIRTLEIGANREENLNTIKEIQREFIETGHVPFRKKNEIQAAFREAINQKLDQLKVNYAEISGGYGRPRQQNYRNDRDWNQQAQGGNKERIFLQQKIQKLKADVALWENNLGFLAKSAAAAVLRSEFDKKIERTKDEIALLEAKLRTIE